jgi:hypothetical protein
LQRLDRRTQHPGTVKNPVALRPLAVLAHLKAGPLPKVSLDGILCLKQDLAEMGDE